jgi:hypothetical protein
VTPAEYFLSVTAALAGIAALVSLVYVCFTSRSGPNNQ